MPRNARVDVGGQVYHIINRANGRQQIFDKEEDYKKLFENILLEATELLGMRILAYVIMPNHWHLVVYPQKDGDLGGFMHRLTNTHTRLVRSRTSTIGHGHLYQGRYKSFIVDTDNYSLALIKYVERNPVRAKLCKNAEGWQWGSAWIRIHGSIKQKKLLSPSPTPLPLKYRTWVNTQDKEEDVFLIRHSVNKGVPYGRERWVDAMVDKYNLGSTLRRVGRPKKI